MHRLTLAAAVALAAGCSDPVVDRGPVTVTVLDRGPVAGAEVTFLNPDGREAGRRVTDAQGRAAADLERGGSVTVARFQPGTTDAWLVETFTDVAPGDALVLDATNVLWGGSLAGQAHVTFPGPFEGAIQYMANLGCTGTFWSSTPEPAAPWLSTACGAALDGIAEARDGRGLVAWSALSEVPVTGAVPDQAATLAFGPWRSDLLALVVTGTNPPAEGGVLTARYEPRRNGFPFVQSSTGGGVALAPPQAATISIAAARDFWTSAQFAVSVSLDDGSRGLIENDASLASRTLDLSAILPPRLSGLTLAQAAGRTTVSWTQAGPFGGQDGTIFASGWYGARGRLLWRVLLPPGRTTFDLPALPAGAVPFGPAGGATMSDASVTSYDAWAPVASFRDLQAAYGPLAEGAPVRGPTSIRWTSTLTAP